MAKAAANKATDMTDDELEKMTRPETAAPGDQKPGPTTDPDTIIVGDDPEVEEFPDEELDPHAEADQQDRVVIDAQRQEQLKYEHELVTIRPRRNLVRTRIGTAGWYTFEKGKLYKDVPRWVADWLMEQGYL